MVNAQEWLNQKFPTLESKKETKSLNFIASHLPDHYRHVDGYDENNTLATSEHLEGDLNFAEFSNLEKLRIIIAHERDNVKITSINLIGCQKLTTSELKELSSNNKSVNKIEFGQHSSLTELTIDCFDFSQLNLNQLPALAKLKVIRCSQLKELDFSHLTNLNFLEVDSCYNLVNIKGLEKCLKLTELKVNRNSNPIFTFLETQNQQLFNLISPNSPYNFSSLYSEIKRLKIQDLTIQIPLKKQELEQLTNNAKSKLTRAEQYPLEKLLKKHSKTLQGDNNLEKVNELKETLSEKLTGEELKNLLDKQTEIFNLEQHLGSLQTEQVAQIQQVNLPPQN